MVCFSRVAMQHLIHIPIDDINSTTNTHSRLAHNYNIQDQGPARKPRSFIEQGVTIFTKLNDLNAEKNPSSVVT